MLEKKEISTPEQENSMMAPLPVELLVHLFSFFNNNEKRVAKGVSHLCKDVIDKFFTHKNIPLTYNAHKDGYVSSFILLPGHRIVFSVVLEKTTSLSRAGLIFFNCKENQNYLEVGENIFQYFQNHCIFVQTIKIDMLLILCQVLFFSCFVNQTSSVPTGISQTITGSVRFYR